MKFLKKPPKKRENKEHRMQADISDHCCKILNEDLVRWTSRETGIGSNAKWAVILQKLWKWRGVKSGWPDMEFHYKDSTGTAQSLFIELKVGDNGAQDNQKEVHEGLRRVGKIVEIAYSLEEVCGCFVKHSVPHLKSTFIMR